MPIVAATPDEACALAGQIVPLAPDAVELRADYLADSSPEAVSALLSRLAAYDLPILFTNRVASKGGARAQDEEARLATLVAAIESAVPALVDVELATAPALREPCPGRRPGSRRGVPVLLSFHHFGETPPDDELLAHVTAMQAVGADAAKLAVMPREAGDATRLLTLCHAITSGATGDIAIPLAAMSMGPLGMITRVLGHRSRLGPDLRRHRAGGRRPPATLDRGTARLLGSHRRGGVGPFPGAAGQGCSARAIALIRMSRDTGCGPGRPMRSVRVFLP